jgi:hypothetical protein|tara:strand:- start:337 stop:747 length:411 start_codon:yes stop_codon:yes gene_type:complete
MATTTATVTISSADLTGDALSLSTTATLTKAQSANTGLEQTTGVARKYYSTAQTATVLLDATDYATGTQATKVYVKNLSSTKSETVTLQINDASNTIELGKLYGGDWAFFPWDGVNDIEIDTSATAMTIEYLAIYE